MVRKWRSQFETYSSTQPGLRFQQNVRVVDEWGELTRHVFQWLNITESEIIKVYDYAPVLRGTSEEHVLELVEVGFQGELVHERLADVVGVLQGELMQRPGLLPLLHEPHA